MSEPLDFIQYPSREITDPMREDPCYPPRLQLTDSPSPESFDQEVDGDEEVSAYFPSEKVAAFFFTSRDTHPTISTKIATPSAITNSESTDSNHEIFSSQYSFNVTSSESDYLHLSECETNGSVNSWRYGMQTFVSSPEFTGPLPHIPPLNPAGAHGIMDANPTFVVDGYSTTTQQPGSVTCVDPAALSVPVHVTSDLQAQKAKKPFKCPVCAFCSARKHNLKTHIETHYKEASKKFECSTCGRRFSRKHDLSRHSDAIHGNRMSSRRRFDIRAGPLYRTTTVCGDGRLTSPLQPGASSATGLEDLTARWEYATWLQGA